MGDNMPETIEQRKEREHQEDLQRLRGFRPIDDDFMRCQFDPISNNYDESLRP